MSISSSWLDPPNLYLSHKCVHTLRSCCLSGSTCAQGPGSIHETNNSRSLWHRASIPIQLSRVAELFQEYDHQAACTSKASCQHQSGWGHLSILSCNEPSFCFFGSKQDQHLDSTLSPNNSLNSWNISCEPKAVLVAERATHTYRQCGAPRPCISREQVPYQLGQGLQHSPFYTEPSPALFRSNGYLLLCSIWFRCNWPQLWNSVFQRFQ